MGLEKREALPPYTSKQSCNSQCRFAFFILFFLKKRVICIFSTGCFVSTWCMNGMRVSLSTMIPFPFFFFFLVFSHRGFIFSSFFFFSSVAIRDLYNQNFSMENNHNCSYH